MSNDAIKRASGAVYESALTPGLGEVLQALAALPAQTEVPYVTASIDWTVDGWAPGKTYGAEVKASQRRSGGDAHAEGTTRRIGRNEIAHELKKLVDAHGPRGPLFDAFLANSEQILNFLDSELDPSAHGAFVVAHAPTGLLETVALGMPIPTSLRVGPTPTLSKIARQIEDNPPYAVLLGDQQQANLTIVTRSRPAGSLSMTGSRWPKHQKQGGAQQRYQERAENRIDTFVKDVAAVAEQEMQALGIQMVVVAGDEVFTSALNAGISKQLREKVVKTIALDIRSTEPEIVAATMPIIEEAERAKELADAKAVHGAIASDNRGAGGAIAVLQALGAGQVDRLIMNEDVEETGWADFTLGLYGAGAVPATHPAGGDVANLVEIDLDEELIRQAVQTGAAIEIIDIEVPVDGTHVPKAGEPLPRSEAATILDQFGGVAAILRF